MKQLFPNLKRRSKHKRKPGRECGWTEDAWLRYGDLSMRTPMDDPGFEILIDAIRKDTMMVTIMRRRGVL